MANERGISRNFICLGVVINNQNEVLVVRRVQEEKGKGEAVLRWAFPGGRVEKNETREDCVKRETLLETGYKIVPLRQISLRMHPDTSVIVVYFLCRLEEQNPPEEPSEPHEIAEIRWVKAQELPHLFTTSIDPGVIKELKIA